MFLLNDEVFVMLLNLLYCDGTGYAEILELNTTNVFLSCENFNVNADIFSLIIHIENLISKNVFKVQVSSRKKIVSVYYNIKEKCILMNIDSDNTFVSMLPNTTEI